MKADVERYIRTKGIPSTFVLPGYFMTNFTAFQMLKKGEDGVFNLCYPVSDRAAFPLFDAQADTGKYVIAAVKNRTQVLGKQILAAADYYTPTRIISEFEEITGKQGKFISIDSETYKSFLPGPMADEMLENHLFIEEPGYYAGRSLEESRQLLTSVGLQPTTWKAFLMKNKDSF
ncbi:unnamed protein product [Clonostachys rosea]|uniref:NmrA-like domain-containing protein n=1 Tax=Bionectria ochroleuca TaxID=29856 RepID=A0ABY6UHX3_BIOOC|nr:unnamed protein product [Clonostachys rosea]